MLKVKKINNLKFNNTKYSICFVHLKFYFFTFTLRFLSYLLLIMFYTCGDNIIITCNRAILFKYDLFTD